MPELSHPAPMTMIRKHDVERGKRLKLLDVPMHVKSRGRVLRGYIKEWDEIALDGVEHSSYIYVYGGVEYSSLE